MIPPPLPENEEERLAALKKYQLLDTLSEERFDNITDLAAYICKVPISLITLMDKERNFIKSGHGVEERESPRNISFCGHALISDEEITIIEDARKDERFIDNPLVNDVKAIFYAGVPLVDPDGYKLGTLCIYDHQPRKLDDDQIKALRNLSNQVMNLILQHYQNLQLTNLHEQLSSQYEELEKFAHVVSHDLKSPLSNIKSSIQLLEMENDDLGENSKQYISFIKTSATTLSNYIDDILDFYKSDALSIDEVEVVPVDNLVKKLKGFITIENDVEFTVEKNTDVLFINPSAILQILVNLVSNGLKYNFSDKRKIHLKFSEDTQYYSISVSDNGKGIAREHQDQIFELFTVLEGKDRSGNKGSGLGLAAVKKLVERMGGTIKVDSKKGEGSTFSFTLPKNG